MQVSHQLRILVKNMDKKLRTAMEADYAEHAEDAVARHTGKWSIEAKFGDSFL